MKVSYPASYNNTDRLFREVISIIHTHNSNDTDKYLIKTHDDKYISVPVTECIKLN